MNWWTRFLSGDAGVMSEAIDLAQFQQPAVAARTATSTEVTVGHIDAARAAIPEILPWREDDSWIWGSPIEPANPDDSERLPT